MLWTEDVMLKLRSLWDEGHSTAEIGRRLGITKNAVVGKAHRLDLPSRPSPIRRDGTGSSRRRTPRRVNGPTLPPLASVRSASHVAPGAPAFSVRARPEPQPTPPVKLATPVISGGRSLRVVPCCWPMGEPGTRSFRFCDVASLPGKPYCDAHAELAYVRIRPRRDDAA